MSETIKYITEKLTSAPFNRNFNFITFDGLEPSLLLQIVSDVLGELDSKVLHKVDIREEAPEQTTMRMLEVLRMLRYKVPTDADALYARLLTGDKFLIYPILEWLLKNFEENKKRAYLARFLVKVQVPAEFLQDTEIAKLYSEVNIYP
ncbi:unnamed protein product [Schistocephalus solidus]|uniref:Intraflagellar transport protein 81 homolog n=1 Tax=Schistocephalus solidus TaxID=70667 RepID=A0A183TJB7_SCHSO|nr:unnamed protein product [Schistocephalus solidus]